MNTYPDLYSDLYDAAFPLSPLDTRVEVKTGTVWTDVTDWVYQRNPVTITRGRPDETSNANPSSCALTLNNRAKQFSPRNPTGPYYGKIGRNSPLRLSLPSAAGTVLRLEDDNTSYAWCPDAPRLNFTGDLDLRLELDLSSYGQMTLATKWNSSTDRAWAFQLNPTGTLVLEYIDSSDVGHLDTGTAPIPLGHIAVRVTLQVDNGSSGRTTTFYTASTIAGPWTQLGDAVVKTGALTGLFATPAPITVGFSPGYITTSGNTNHTGPNGRVYAFEMLSGIDGTTVASPVFAGQPVGARMFLDTQGNPWLTAGTASIDDRDYRFHGEVPAWTPRWDSTGNDITAELTVSGVLRRLGAPTQRPLDSAMHRAYTRITGTPAPVAYWPCEDGSGSVQLASALTGAAPMNIAGTPQLAGNSSFAGSAPIPLVADSSWDGPVPATATTANTLRFNLLVSTGSEPADGTILARLYTSGTVAFADLVYGTGGALQAVGYDSGGNQLFATLAIRFAILDKPCRVSLELQTSGSDVQYSIVVIFTANTGFSGGTATVAGSIGHATQVRIAPLGGVDQVAIGHITVQATWDSLFGQVSSALIGWSGESAGARFIRLCQEEGVPYRVYGHPSDTVTMGPQSTQTFLALLQECETADHGMITEAREALAIGYRTRVSMLNQGATAALSYTSKHLSPDVLPTDDDLLTINDMTASRSGGGSSARVYQADGPLSVLAPPDGVGPYQSAQTVNVQSDAMLPDQAGWLVHLGTVDELRYPALPVNLARSAVASVADDLAAVDLGDRVTVSDPPAFLPPDDISQLVRGLTETCYAFTRTISFACAPESAYRVGVYGDATLGRYDTDGSIVAVAVDATATSLKVATVNAGSPLWTTDSADWPFDIQVAGERMTVTEVSGSSSPQTFTVTRSVNGVVKDQAAGTAVSLFQPAVYSL